jgi:hypothetical protein
VLAGLQRARRQGQKLGRRRARISDRDLAQVRDLSVRDAAAVLGVPASRVHRERRRLFQIPSGAGAEWAGNRGRRLRSRLFQNQLISTR